MNNEINSENENNIALVNGTIGNEISPTLTKLIKQYYNDIEKIMTSAYENFFILKGFIETENGEITDELYSRVFVKEKERINIFTERDNSSETVVTTIPTKRVDNTEAHYKVIDDEHVMAGFTVYYENGQSYELHIQPDSTRVEVVADLFQFLTDDSRYV
ncbi:hypothetical protein ABLV94_07280 [Staphylococcus sp. Mo2-7]|uniref:hypothetical protein n=1 Tax=Staphylococcus sp. Mo2-6 TaxID=3135641 RepID=UPI0033687C7B